MEAPQEHAAGWRTEEIRLDEPTRSSRLRWVVVVDADLPAGAAVNAAACIAASAGASVAGLVGPGGADADGTWHRGLPWAGCTVLGASTAELAALRAQAVAAEDVTVFDMPGSAQTNRVYADHLTELGETPADDLDLRAVSVLGRRTGSTGSRGASTCCRSAPRPPALTLHDRSERRPSRSWTSPGSEGAWPLRSTGGALDVERTAVVGLLVRRRWRRR